MVELFFRRHFWVVHVVLLAVAAYLLATTLHIGTELLLRGETKVSGRAAPVRAPTTGDSRDFEEPNDQNIFMGKRELLVPPDPNDVVVDAGPDTPDAEYDYAKAVLSELRANLVGVSVFLEPTYSLASIIDEAEGRNATAKVYSINDCDAVPPPLEDGGLSDEGMTGPPPRPCKLLMEVAEVVHIALDRVYVKNNDTGRLEYIPLEEDPNAPKGPVSSRAKPVKKPDGKDDDLGKGFTKVGPNSYEVEQGEVDKALGNLSSLATQARIVPAFEGGKAIGFKLFSIRPGSLYSKIGVQNGDVIQKVNGYEMNSPDQALEVYQKLKDSKSVSVDIKRRGKPVTLDYAIK